MERLGTCLDNAVAETFFATLKVELIHRRPWPSRADVVQAIFASVETWYNPHRRHGSLGYISPVAFEASQPSALSAPKPMAVRINGCKSIDLAQLFAPRAELSVTITPRSRSRGTLGGSQKLSG